jgi:hypothetical protein
VRAQSEIIGFVLIFALIVSTTGVVYVAGFSSLENARTAEELNNVERAFDVLDDNVRDVSRRSAPSRATELSLGNGGIALAESTNVTVRATNTSDPLDNRTVTVETRPIVYRLDDTSIAYTSGATIRRDRNDATMISEPRWTVTDDRTVVPLLGLSQSGRTGSLSGDTTILVRTQRDSRSVPVRFAPRSGSRVNVTVTITSPRAGAWKQFLERRGFTAVDAAGADPTDNVIAYEIETDALYVQQTTVSVTLTR